MQDFDETNPFLESSLVETTLEDHTLPGISEGEIIVIRSTRRKKNVSAYRQGGRIVVSIPARMSKADERAMVPEMVAKIRAQEAAATMSEETISNRDGRAITGLSMGGHGALYLSFKHQDVFGVAGSMSGGVDFRPFTENWDIKKRLGPITENPENWDKNTVTNMLDLVKDNNLKLIIDCGFDDFFMEVNRQLHQKMLTLKINHDYIERPGEHNLAYWENSLKFQLLFFDNFFKEKKK